MHPLHDYIAGQLAEKLKARRIVVWYDPRSEFAPFVDEVRAGARGEGVPEVRVRSETARLAAFTGSFFALRSAVEPFVADDEPSPVLVYVPGMSRDREGSLLMELEKAGECYEPQLKRLARNVLREQYTDGVIDKLLASERVVYEDLARAAAAEGTEPPSILKGIFRDATPAEALIAEWLATEERDVEIETKEAKRELTALLSSRLGLEAPEDASIAKLRAIVIRHVLVNEFRLDLLCPSPSVLASVVAPGTKDQMEAAREVARRLRSVHARAYESLADRVEAELSLANAEVPPEAFGSIDTFRFEERAFLRHCGELVAEGRYDEAFSAVSERERSFWLDRDVTRKAQWEALRLMAGLGSRAKDVVEGIKGIGNEVRAWVDAYSRPGGWHLLDQAQRSLETWATGLDEEPEERPLGKVRRAFEDACSAMAAGFSAALRSADWTVPGALTQSRIYPELVVPCPKPVAYFLVDALRFEMGMELLARLP